LRLPLLKVFTIPEPAAAPLLKKLKSFANAGKSGILRSRLCFGWVLAFFGRFYMTSLKPRISVEYGKDATIITFTDEKILEERDIVELQESLMGVIEQTEKIRLILDFSTVKFLSSAVLGLLIRVSKKVYERDGQLRLCNISPRIYEIFRITRLTKIFDIFPDRASAAASFASTQ
jgi:anti-sigma B factor antagonist